MEKLLEHALDLKWFKGILSADPEIKYWDIKYFVVEYLRR